MEYEFQSERVQRRALGSIMNLACSETASLLGNCKDLLSILVKIATSDFPSEIVSRASSALLKISNAMDEKMLAFPILLTALTDGHSLPHVDVLTVIFRQMVKEIKYRSIMANHVGLVNSLSCIALRDDTSCRAKENTARTLLQLTTVDSNRYIMTNPSVLDAFVSMASMEQPEFVIIRESAITALARLAADPLNRKGMASHKGLITCLARAVEAEYQSLTFGKSNIAIAKPALLTLLINS